MTSTKLKRLLVAVVSLLAVSAAVAFGAYPHLPAVTELSPPVDSMGSWAAGLLAEDAWKVLAALAIMAVIAKRSGKA
jgi:hypothetical protein